MNLRKKNIVFRSKSAFLITFFSAAWFLCSGGMLHAAAPLSDVRANISVKSRPLAEVVLLVQEQTGYKVEIESIDGSFLVTGEYHSVAVEKIFTRLLKGYNVSVAINHLNKSISVISLGDKIQLAKGSKIPGIGSPVAAEVKEPESVLPPAVAVDSSSSDKIVSDLTLELTGLSSQDIQVLHTQQAKEFEQRQHIPATVDPLTGLSSAELEQMHKQQIKELNQPVK